MLKILLTGANGQLGQEMLNRCPSDIKIEATDYKELDITSIEACREYVSKIKPDRIVNAAAYTNVEQAEDEPEKAMLLNRDGAANLASVSKEAGIRFLHISTDFVFSGKNSRPYSPDDRPEPLSVYGHTKLAGEEAVKSILGKDALIIRTAWLYSRDGKNFVNTIIRLLKEQPFLKVIHNQHGTPTSTVSLTDAIYAAIEADARGTHHWTDAGETTWFDFACEIQKQALKYGIIKEEKEIKPVTSDEFKTKALRPTYSVLDKSSFISETGFSPRPWQELLEENMKSKAV